MPDPLVAEFVPPSPGGELTAKRHGAAVLVVEAARGTREWPFGATLDGVLTLDLDCEHVLVHADLIWKRSRWNRGSVSLPPSSPAAQRLRLPNLSSDALAGRTIDVTPVLDGATLAIWLAEQEAEDCIPLGRGVGALTRGSTLAGLAVEGV